jgi:putative peptidoglycan lipid II flippase
LPTRWLDGADRGGAGAGFYSRQDIKTPVKIAIVTLIMTQLMNLAFIGPLKHAGLSLSIGLAACLNAGLLYWQLRKQDIFTPQPGWAVSWCV